MSILKKQASFKVEGVGTTTTGAQPLRRRSSAGGGRAAVIKRFKECLTSPSRDWGKLFKEIDQSGDGQVSYEELLSAMRTQFNVSESMMPDSVIKDVFEILDKGGPDHDGDREGTVDLAELVRVVAKKVETKLGCPGQDSEYVMDVSGDFGACRNCKYKKKEHVEKFENKIHQIFFSIDNDHGGVIEKDELLLSLEKIGLPRTKLKELRQKLPACMSVDVDGFERVIDQFGMARPLGIVPSEMHHECSQCHQMKGYNDFAEEQVALPALTRACIACSSSAPRQLEQPAQEDDRARQEQLKREQEEAEAKARAEEAERKRKEDEALEAEKRRKDAEKAEEECRAAKVLMGMSADEIRQRAIEHLTKVMIEAGIDPQLLDVSKSLEKPNKGDRAESQFEKKYRELREVSAEERDAEIDGKADAFARALDGPENLDEILYANLKDLKLPPPPPRPVVLSDEEQLAQQQAAEEAEQKRREAEASNEERKRQKEEERIENLCGRFEGVPRETVLEELRKADGNAPKAVKQLQAMTNGGGVATPAKRLSPAADSEAEAKKSAKDAQVIDNLCKRFSAQGVTREMVEAAFQEANGETKRTTKLLQSQIVQKRMADKHKK